MWCQGKRDVRSLSPVSTQPGALRSVLHSIGANERLSRDDWKQLSLVPNLGNFTSAPARIVKNLIAEPGSGRLATELCRRRGDARRMTKQRRKRSNTWHSFRELFNDAGVFAVVRA